MPACPNLKKISRLELTDDKQAIISLSSLLEAKGLDASDFIEVINALSKIKQRESQKQEAEENRQKKKHYLDKEFVFETRRDIFIYRSGATKSGRYYVRIYDEKTKKDFVQSLRTANRIEALAKAEEIYAERKNCLRRGVKLKSITTHELIRLYTCERMKTITTIPHQGITKESFATMVKQLKYWQEYINSKRYGKVKIEDIPPDIGKGFGIWMKELSKERYKDRERSNETINHAIATVKKMYRDIAIDEKYITMAEFPIFRYLKINREKSHKRDIIEQEEFFMLRRWMRRQWCNEAGISELEKIKRYIYSQYLTINYYTGCRNKEMLGIRWGDISLIKHEDKQIQQINRSIFIPAENSKTGRSRSCVAPVGLEFENIKRCYKNLGITNFGKNDFVFINLAKTKRGLNIPYNQPAMEKRLHAVIDGSGLKKILDETGRHITQYSARHYAVTDALMRGVSIYDIALNVGTSVHYIEQTYSKVTTLKKSMEITKGQGIHKVIETVAATEDSDVVDYEITADGGVKVGATEHQEDGRLTLHYGEYYAQLSRELQHEDDYSWLSFMKLDSRIPFEEVNSYEESLRQKWGEEQHIEGLQKYVEEG